MMAHRPRFAEPLVRLVRDLVRNDWGAVEIGRGLFDDPDRVTELEHHHLAGWVYLRLKESSLITLVPPPHRRRLRDYYTRQWLRTERLLFELGPLLSAFAAACLPVILLKGPFLAQRFYGGFDRRAVSDIDLLVRPENLLRACSIVEACGFAMTSWMPYGHVLARRYVHHVEFMKDGIPLDLHHVVRIHPAFRFDEEALWSRAAPFEIQGRVVTALADEHSLLLHLLSIHQEIGVGTQSLRPFLDLLLMLRAVSRGFEWPEFLAQRRRDGTLRICVNVLALCLGVFGVAEDFPEVSAIVAANANEIVLPLRDGAGLGLIREYRFFRNKIWFFRLFPGSLLLTLAWWAAGLPIRYTAHRSTLWTRLLSAHAPPRAS